MRSGPSRVSPDTFPIAASATARAYDFDYALEPEPAPAPVVADQGQLFSAVVNEPRVIPFDSLTSQAERESIRARAADLARPAPVKTARVEVRRPRQRKTGALHQRTLEFQGQQEVLGRPEPNIIFAAQVAPAMTRVRAAMVDGLIIACAYALAAVPFLYERGQISLDKHVLPFLLAILITIPVLYKLLWTLAGRDSIGMQSARLRLIDFDGNPPSKARRYQRLVGSVLSLLAAGVGLIWALVDADKLTWHDHISGTFPTVDYQD
ncbi:MAG TPA: RDD family protein [Bryobacteraceae bacterium]|nr:RDD family protein [Bryobacteraceae bacterium]